MNDYDKQLFDELVKISVDCYNMFLYKKVDWRKNDRYRSSIPINVRNSLDQPEASVSSVLLNLNQLFKQLKHETFTKAIIQYHHQNQKLIKLNNLITNMRQSRGTRRSVVHTPRMHTYTSGDVERYLKKVLLEHFKVKLPLNDKTLKNLRNHYPQLCTLFNIVSSYAGQKDKPLSDVHTAQWQSAMNDLRIGGGGRLGLGLGIPPVSGLNKAASKLATAAYTVSKDPIPATLAKNIIHKPNPNATQVLLEAAAGASEAYNQSRSINVNLYRNEKSQA